MDAPIKALLSSGRSPAPSSGDEARPGEAEQVERSKILSMRLIPNRSRPIVGEAPRASGTYASFFGPG